MTSTAQHGDGRVAVPGRTCRVGRYVFAHAVTGSGSHCAQQLREAIAALDATLRAAGSALDRVERITYYVRDAADVPADVHGAWFVDCWPRTTVVELRTLPAGVVELEATATVVDA